MLSFAIDLVVALWDVGAFWRDKAVSYVFRPTERDLLLERLQNASSYEEWDGAARELDRILGIDMWRQNAISSAYDYRLIEERRRIIETARNEGDINGLLNTLRTGLVRNLGNITSSKLFNTSFAGTKRLIDDYIEQYVDALRELSVLPPPDTSGQQPTVEVMSPGWEDGETDGDDGLDDDFGARRPSAPVIQCRGGMATATFSIQRKLDFMHDTRQGFGRSALVLQGGAIFGMCHLGVVKGLLLRGMLPKILVGTGTGAMMAALVGVHPDHELLRILTEDEIDLSAFSSHGKDPQGHNERVMRSTWIGWETLVRRIQRFRREGYFLDVKVLEECVRANIGDLTFEEAYNRSRRILNITVVTAGQQGVPTLLNYVTAPNVLVWTAAVASNASSEAFYGSRQTKILCKDARGNIEPWAPAAKVDFRHWTSASYTDRNAPLQRLSGLFNVNHYVVSQARPYLIPFVQSDMHGPSAKYSTLSTMRSFFTRMIGLETRHRLRQLDRLRLLPASIRRFLVDEHLPGPSVTLVPKISLRDFVRLLETPTRDSLQYWILRGERSVWPSMAAIRVRCAIEMELDRAYEDVKRFKAGDLRRRASGVNQHRLADQAGPSSMYGAYSSSRADGSGSGAGGRGRNRGGNMSRQRRTNSITARCPPSTQTSL
ncbi:acyl transferase/acyl hydrolase/lysophospholipase [Chaetomium sp. MPI-SDFR-AT-0129]|nr:acyl transferase/acyl hydrolase/lysophospholipase [Chaetomium sp. MPI-SDFR-AT-0129]